MTAKEEANKSAKMTMSVLSTAFVALSGYVHFLKNKLDQSTITLDKAKFCYLDPTPSCKHVETRMTFYRTLELAA